FSTTAFIHPLFQMTAANSRHTIFAPAAGRYVRPGSAARRGAPTTGRAAPAPPAAGPPAERARSRRPRAVPGGGRPPPAAAESAQSGWTPTTGSSKPIQLAKGQTLSGVDFGNDLAVRRVCLPPPAGMVASWTFNESSGGIAHDNAGFDDAGAHVGAPDVVPGK